MEHYSCWKVLYSRTFYIEPTPSQAEEGIDHHYFLCLRKGAPCTLISIVMARRAPETQQ
jgi:hypothetical protein